MLNVALGTGASASGFCCLSIGDGAVTRGAYQVVVTQKLTFPDATTIEVLDALNNALADLSLTHQALVEQKFAPPEFGVRSKGAIDIAIDACTRRRQQLVDAATPVDTTPPLVPKDKEEAASSSTTESRAEQVD